VRRHVDLRSLWALRIYLKIIFKRVDSQAIFGFRAL